MNTTRLRFRGPVLVEELALELELEVAPALVMTMELMRGSTLAKEAGCHWASNGSVSAGASTVPPVSPPVSVVAAGFTRTSLWRSWRSWPLAWQLLRAEVWGQRKADA